jgi:hypothetical protein
METNPDYRATRDGGLGRVPVVVVLSSNPADAAWIDDLLDHGVRRMLTWPDLRRNTSWASIGHCGRTNPREKFPLPADPDDP